MSFYTTITLEFKINMNLLRYVAEHLLPRIYNKYRCVLYLCTSVV